MSHYGYHTPVPADRPDAAGARLPYLVAGATAALVDARRHLEAALADQPDWRALVLLPSRTAVTSDTPADSEARERLTRSLATQPVFMAWQFVDAALTFLAAEQRAEAQQATAARPAAPKPADSAPAPAAVAVDDTESCGDAATAPAESPAAAAGLTTRIPTLLAHEGRAPLTGVLAQAADDPVDAEADGRATAYDDDGTRFVSDAVGIPEAEVRIIVREPAKSLIDARLPPLPFDDRALSVERGSRLPRASRATAVKWADADAAESDFRPVGSAMDEAQVAIISTGANNESQSRAERRALGVAPDREQHMRRFLRALSGK